MTYLNLIIASFLAALASEGQPTVNKTACRSTTAGVEQVESLDSKQKLRKRACYRWIAMNVFWMNP